MDKSPANNETQEPRPFEWIQVYVAYPWDKGATVRKDERWCFLRDTIRGVLREVEKLASTKGTGKKFSYRCNRLRATHGGELLPCIIRRIVESDILVFDITHQNPNVMLELGCCLSFAQKREGRLFIFAECNNDKSCLDNIPSDLRGMMLTFYRQANAKTASSQKYELVDSNGFRAALRTALIKCAIDKGLWQLKGGDIDPEDNP